MQDPPVLLTSDPTLRLAPGPGAVTIIDKEMGLKYSLRSTSDLPKARAAVPHSLEIFRSLSQQFEKELERWNAAGK